MHAWNIVLQNDLIVKINIVQDYPRSLPLHRGNALRTSCSLQISNLKKVSFLLLSSLKCKIILSIILVNSGFSNLKYNFRLFSFTLYSIRLFTINCVLINTNNRLIFTGFFLNFKNRYLYYWNPLETNCFFRKKRCLKAMQYQALVKNNKFLHVFHSKLFNAVVYGSIWPGLWKI